MKLPVLLLLVFVLAASASFAADEFKPYLHKATVPEHPNVRLFGSYQTSLFPGAATYSYPIDVPPGTHGLQPSLALMFNSQSVKGRPGVLGSGWELTQNFIMLNVNNTPLTTSDDFYMLSLNGMSEKLFRGGEGYVTETEHGWRVENLSGGDNDLGQYWVITLKDGTQYRFGDSVDSELVVDNKGMKWGLNLITDSFGNTVTYSYLESPFVDDLNAVYLDTIQYNRDLQRVVRFVYEGNTRPDRRRVVNQAFFFEESRRLTGVEVLADDALVRRYAFAFDDLGPAATTLMNVTQFGNDNSSRLHTVSFEYYPEDTSWVNQTTSWILPTAFGDSEANDYGVRMVDVNNDGWADIMQDRQNFSMRQTFLNNKSGGWTNTTSFLSPVRIVDDFDADEGVRFGDVNGDGWLDMVQSINDGGGDRQQLFLNTHTGWNNVTSDWIIPVEFYRLGDNGVEFEDVNGDGLVDFVQAKDDGGFLNAVYINTGHGGWVNTSSWGMTTSFVHDGHDNGARLVDLNGDGLPDIIQSSYYGALHQGVWLNNGTGWLPSGNWTPPTQFTNSTFADLGVRFSDVNSDGLVDIVRAFTNFGVFTAATWLNNGSGWSLASNWTAPEPFTAESKNTGRRLADVNGDGIADALTTVGTGNGYAQLKTYANGLLLKAVVNEYGGRTEVNYTPSTVFNNTGDDGVSDLGFPVYVVSKVNSNNSLSGVFNVLGTTSYVYSGGLYDAVEKEMRGFSNVTETLADGTFVLHHFLQGDATKGKEFKTETVGSQGLLSVSLMNYSSTFLNPNFKVVLESQTQEQYDGSATPFVTQASFAYDPYLNVVEKDSFGDVAVEDDDRIEKYEYEYATNNHIVDKPIHYQLFEADNSTKVKESTFSYDDGIISKGGLTRVENWNDRGDNVVNHFTYDDYGNKVSMMDPLGHVMTYEYGLRDPTFTFMDRMTNALGHKEEYVYDFGTGNLLSKTKNEITTSYAYDVFGRVVKEVQPYDSDSLPTKTYNYSFDGVAPEEVSLSLRETANVKNKALQYFYDGFAQVVQIKSEADDNQFVTKNLYYDNLGRVVKEDNPYFASAPWFQAPANGTPATNYSYDGLGRVYFVLNPDGTNKTIQFNRTVITDFDENGHKHAYHLDGFGQISKVQEFNNDPVLGIQFDPYNTTYEYDDQGNLVLITDSESNEFKFTYDSLGRKVALDDPDLGRWTYEYDVAGNIVRQVDNRGIALNIVYDEINRALLKNSSGTKTGYGYDGQFDGTLTNESIHAATGNDTYVYLYDDRMRKVRETQTQDSLVTVKDFVYDSMNRVVKVSSNDSVEYYYSKQGKVQKIPGFIDYSTYNSFGSLLMRNYTSGRVTEFTYDDANNRIEELTTGLKQRLRYTFDGVGNVLLINDSVNGRAHNLGYDYLDRLTSAMISGDVFKYEYDALGRIQKTQKNNVVKRYEYLGLQAHAPSDIVSRAPNVSIHSAEDLDTESKTRVYEFYLMNETGNKSQANWTVTVAGTSITSNQFNVTSPILVLVEYNHSKGGEYAVNVTTKQDVSSFNTTFGLDAVDVTSLSKNASTVVSAFTIANDVAEQITGVSWACGGVGSSVVANLSGNSELMVIVEQNYSRSGIETLNCSARSNDGNDTETGTVMLNGLAVEQLNTVSANINTKVISFDVANTHDPTTLTFNTSTGETNLVNTTTLLSGASIMVFEEINYSVDGQKNISVNIGSNLLNETGKDSLMLEALPVQYDRYDDNSSTQIAYFTVENDWVTNVSLNFSSSAAGLNNITNLTVNKSLMVFLEESYNSGAQEPVFEVFSSNFTTLFVDAFTIVPVDLLNYQILRQNQSSTVAEFDIRNNDNLTNISWKMDTSVLNLTSNMSISLNETQTVMIFVETNYSSTGIYATIGKANSSTNSDNSTGVAVI